MRAGSQVPFFTEKLTRKSPKNLLFVAQCLFIFSQIQGLGRGAALRQYFKEKNTKSINKSKTFLAEQKLL